MIYDNKYLFFLLLIPTLIFANSSLNGWQPFQPARTNYNARSTQPATLVFGNSFSDGNITPEIGTAGSFTRASAQNYFSSASVLSQASTGVEAIPAFTFGSTVTNGGLLLTGNTRNICKENRSFDVVATWTAVGTGSATANTWTPPSGTAVGDTITSVLADDGVQQNLGITVTGKTVMGSLFVKSSSGSVPFKVTVLGSGGTPDPGVTAGTATTTVQLFQFNHTFTTGSGNIIVKITLDNAVNDLLVSHIECADRSGSGFEKAYTGYVQDVNTTTSTGSSVGNDINFSGTEIAALSAKNWSVSSFFAPYYDGADMINGGSSKYLFCGNGDTDSPCAYVGRDGGQTIVAGWIGNGSTGFFKSNAITLTEFTYANISIIVNYNASPYVTVKFNNVDVGLQTIPSAFSAPTWSTLAIGRRAAANKDLYLDAVQGAFLLFEGTISDTDLTAYYDLLKGGYGL